MNHPRVWNLLSSLPPLAPLIKYNFERVRYTREASKVDSSLSPYCYKTVLEPQQHAVRYKGSLMCEGKVR